MKTGYTDEELDKLHRCLYDILRETVRVCNEINVKFFMVGGSMIGCHFGTPLFPLTMMWMWACRAVTMNGFERSSVKTS